MLKLMINNVTMKFHELLTKNERDISKYCNFALSPFFRDAASK